MICLIISPTRGMFGFSFRDSAPRDFDEAKKADTQAFTRFFAALLERGIYLAPSPFEACAFGTRGQRFHHRRIHQVPISASS